MKIVVLAAALLALAVACGGCGGGGAPPRHGILFAHGIVPVGGTIDGGSEIYVREPGGRLRRLVSTRDLRNEPSWSPDGRQIAFVGTACKGYVDCLMQRPLEVYVANSVGSSQRQLTSSASAFRSEYPTWSPNGRSIAVLQELPNSSVVDIISAASGKTRPLHVHGVITQPVWGRPGIAYLARSHRSSDAAFTIRVADPKTGRGRPFASPAPGYGFQLLAWSSQGDLAALEAGLAHRSKAEAVATYDGTGRRISRFQVPEQWVPCGITWSPSGTRLLLTAYRRGHINTKTRQPTPQLYIVDPNGQHWRRLPLGLPLAACRVSWR